MSRRLAAWAWVGLVACSNPVVEEAGVVVASTGGASGQGGGAGSLAGGQAGQGGAGVGATGGSESGGSESGSGGEAGQGLGGQAGAGQGGAGSAGESGSGGEGGSGGSCPPQEGSGLPAPMNGSPGGACCQPSEEPGCVDKSVEACVCAKDEFCCKTAWDSLCVSEVDSFGCGVCSGGGGNGGTGGNGGNGGNGGGPGGPCCGTKTENTAGCHSLNKEVCQNDPRCCGEGLWDQKCVLGIDVCGQSCASVIPPNSLRLMGTFFGKYLACGEGLPPEGVPFSFTGKPAFVSLSPGFHEIKLIHVNEIDFEPGMVPYPSCEDAPSAMLEIDLKPGERWWVILAVNQKAPGYRVHTFPILDAPGNEGLFRILHLTTGVETVLSGLHMAEGWSIPLVSSRNGEIPEQAGPLPWDTFLDGAGYLHMNSDLFLGAGPFSLDIAMDGVGQKHVFTTPTFLSLERRGPQTIFLIRNELFHFHDLIQEDSNISDFAIIYGPVIFDSPGCAACAADCTFSSSDLRNCLEHAQCSYCQGDPACLQKTTVGQALLACLEPCNPACLAECPWCPKGSTP